MSAKIPRIPLRKCWIDGDNGRTLWNGKRVGTGAGLRYPRRVRVTDARDLTAEKAVENVLQQLSDKWQFHHERLNRLVDHLGMTARVVNGKVRVRMVKP